MPLHAESFGVAGFSLYSRDLPLSAPQTGIHANHCYFHPSSRTLARRDCDFASRRHGVIGFLYYKRHQLDARIAWRPEYKTRERIHPGLADPGLLAIPAS